MSVIDASTRNLVATVSVGAEPLGVSINSAGTFAYVANGGSNSVSVIDTQTNTVIRTIAVGASPTAFGQFIGPGLGPVAQTAIPALGKWGLIVLAVLLAIAATGVARRSRHFANRAENSRT